MATYTLSYTGAQVNSAIGSALNLFSKTNTWTGAQTFTGALTISGETVADSTIDELTVPTLLTCDGTATLNSVSIDDLGCVDASFSGNFVSSGSATFTGTCDIADLTVTTDTSTATLSVTYGASVGGDLLVAGRVEVANDLIAKDRIRVCDPNDEDHYCRIYFTKTAIASASHDCVAIDDTGASAINAGDPIPAYSLIFEFE